MKKTVLWAMLLANAAMAFNPPPPRKKSKLDPKHIITIQNYTSDVIGLVECSDEGKRYCDIQPSTSITLYWDEPLYMDDPAVLEFYCGSIKQAKSDHTSLPLLNKTEIGRPCTLAISESKSGIRFKRM